MNKKHIALKVLITVCYTFATYPIDYYPNQPYKSDDNPHLTAWQPSNNNCDPDIAYFSRETRYIAGGQPSKSPVDEWTTRCIKYQQTGDKRYLERIKQQLQNDLNKAWPWQKSTLYERLKLVEDLLNDPLTAQLFIIKNCSFHEAESTFHAIKRFYYGSNGSRHGFNEYQAAKALLESRLEYQKKKQQDQAVLAVEHATNQIMATQRHELCGFMDEYQELNSWYDADSPLWISQCLELYHPTVARPQYVQRSYVLSDAVQQILMSAGYHPSFYEVCTGNQLQQVIHQQCIILLEYTTDLPAYSLLYSYQGALIDCIDAAREHNQNGFVIDAMRIINFCSALFDYGKAVLEGAVTGVVDAVQDIVTHPIQTAACLVAGEYLLAFHLGKLLGNLTDIATDLVFFDINGASRKFQHYLEPLDAICDKIKKKEITLHDGIQAASHGAVYLLAQHKLLGGLGKLYEGVKNKAITFMQNNPLATPQQYLATPDGNLVKAFTSEFTQEETKLSSVLKAEMDRDKIINSAPGIFSEECIEKSVNFILKDDNKIRHIFKNEKHNLEFLVRKLGSKEKVIREIFNEANGKMPMSGEFMNLPVEVCGFTVYIRGNIVNGIPRLGTMFIKEEGLCRGLKNLKS